MQMKTIFVFIIFDLIGLFTYGQASEIFIEAVQSYQDSIKIKHNSKSGKYSIDVNTFNLKGYLNLFDNIEFDSNLKFDYVYFDNYSNGEPYIYAVGKTFNLKDYIHQEALKLLKADTLYEVQIEYKLPFSSEKRKMPEEPKILAIRYDEKRYEWYSHMILYDFINDSTNMACNHIKPLDTEIGYLQYLFFNKLGENFALKLSSYNWKKWIIYSKTRMLPITKEYKDKELFKANKNSLRKLSKIDPTPIVNLNPNNCEITWYEKTYSGIYKCTYRINRFYPHTITMINEKTIIEPTPICTVIF